MTSSGFAKPTRLTRKAIADAATSLAKVDPVLKPVLDRFGAPPLLRRSPTFATLVQIILEQQVSVASANATFARLKIECAEDVIPERVLEIGGDRLGEIGFSRQKANYSLSLAQECTAGRFRVQRLSKLSDDRVREEIVSQKGLGDWSADVFLMMALLRPDILPVGDLALVKGLCEVDRTEYPTREQVIERAERWRPFRSVATRMVWQAYVHKRRRKIV